MDDVTETGAAATGTEPAQDAQKGSEATESATETNSGTEGENEGGGETAESSESENEDIDDVDDDEDRGFDDFFFDEEDAFDPSEHQNTSEEDTEDGEDDDAEPEAAPAASDTAEKADEDGAQANAEATEEGAATGTDTNSATSGIDYAKWAEEDRAAIVAAHPELEGKQLAGMLKDSKKFAALRGSAELRAQFSPLQAFNIANGLAPDGAPESKTATPGASKGHMRPMPKRAADAAATVPRHILAQRETLFPGKSDDEIAKIYKQTFS